MQHTACISMCLVYIKQFLCHKTVREEGEYGSNNMKMSNAHYWNPDDPKERMLSIKMTMNILSVSDDNDIPAPVG